MRFSPFVLRDDFFSILEISMLHVEYNDIMGSEMRSVFQFPGPFLANAPCVAFARRRYREPFTTAKNIYNDEAGLVLNTCNHLILPLPPHPYNCT